MNHVETRQSDCLDCNPYPDCKCDGFGVFARKRANVAPIIMHHSVPRGTDTYSPGVTPGTALTINAMAHWHLVSYALPAETQIYQCTDL